MNEDGVLWKIGAFILRAIIIIPIFWLLAVVCNPYPDETDIQLEEYIVVGKEIQENLLTSSDRFIILKNVATNDVRKKSCDIDLYYNTEIGDLFMWDIRHYNKLHKKGGS